jgi:hypothetical protein
MNDESTQSVETPAVKRGKLAVVVAVLPTVFLAAELQFCPEVATLTTHSTVLRWLVAGCVFSGVCVFVSMLLLLRHKTVWPVAVGMLSLLNGVIGLCFGYMAYVITFMFHKQ